MFTARGLPNLHLVIFGHKGHVHFPMVTDHQNQTHGQSNIDSHPCDYSLTTLIFHQISYHVQFFEGLSMMHYSCLDCIINDTVFNMPMFNQLACVITFSK